MSDEQKIREVQKLLRNAVLRPYASVSFDGNRTHAHAEILPTGNRNLAMPWAEWKAELSLLLDEALAR